MKKISLFILLLSAIACTPVPAQTSVLLKVNTANGMAEGTNDSGIASFKGIPFAQPPVVSFDGRSHSP